VCTCKFGCIVYEFLSDLASEIQIFAIIEGLECDKLSLGSFFKLEDHGNGMNNSLLGH